MSWWSDFGRCETFNVFARYHVERKGGEDELELLASLKDVPLPLSFGATEFLGEEIFLERGVFFPRPETEVAFNDFVQYLEGAGLRKFRFLEGGTGSGALSLALLLRFPQSEGLGVEVDEKSWWYTANNIYSRVEPSRYLVYLCDFLHKSRWGEFDVVLSNPPYVADERLVSELEVFEPRSAFWAGENYDVTRAFLTVALNSLKTGGYFFFELSEKGWEALEHLFKNCVYEKRMANSLVFLWGEKR